MPFLSRESRGRLLVGALALAPLSAFAQDMSSPMPRFDRYQRLRQQISTSVVSGAISPEWNADSQSFTYFLDGKGFKYDVATRTASPTGQLESKRDRNRPRRPGERVRTFDPSMRDRQYDTTTSPDGKLKAVSRDRNVYITDADGKNEIAVTTDGSAAKRLKYGTASWVYAEELDVHDAMWWSPDGNKLAFYRYDEGQVLDYYLQYRQLATQDTLNVEAYPKAGAPNPRATLLVYDRASKQTTPLDTHFEDPSLGEYVYDVRWAPDGREILFDRTDRKQKTMELCAADASTGACRVVVRESQPQSWAENHPIMQFLKDNRRFIWGSERNGFRNLYLVDLAGHFYHAITNHEFDVDGVAKVDDDERTLWYTARSGDAPGLVQLHRVDLDGKHDVRLTDPKRSHTVTVSPDGRLFLDVQQALDTPPESVLRDADGKEVASVAKSDLIKFDGLKLHRAEKFSYTAADGKTIAYGRLMVPSDFDPAKRYPLVVNVYGGPESSGGDEKFLVPDPLTELGFCMAWIDGRGTKGRGKAFRDAVYGKLGVVEIDDQAAGVKELAKRPYIDGGRVGIYGTSYGGYSSIMAILRHPEAFQVACSSSPVTDWRNYDSIYTERFMGLPGPDENEKGYEAGAAKTYAAALRGKLMLYYGTADNNVHPANTLQLIKALENAGKRYDLQVGPDRAHTSMPATAMWEYFVRNLILDPPNRDGLAEVFKRRQTERKKAAGK